MSEFESVELCPECENLQVFTFSGSGRKAFCDGCELSFRKVGKSYKVMRLEDEW